MISYTDFVDDSTQHPQKYGKGMFLVHGVGKFVLLLINEIINQKECLKVKE